MNTPYSWRQQKNTKLIFIPLIIFASYYQLMEVELEDDLETEAEKKARHISLYIVHTSMLVVSLGMTHECILVI